MSKDRVFGRFRKTIVREVGFRGCMEYFWGKKWRFFLLGGVGLMGSMLNYRCIWKSFVLIFFELSRFLGKFVGKSIEFK